MVRNTLQNYYLELVRNPTLYEWRTHARERYISQGVKASHFVVEVATGFDHLCMVEVSELDVTAVYE